MKLSVTVTITRDISDEPMPWCDHCSCYHHETARHINKPPVVLEQTAVPLLGPVQPHHRFSIFNFFKRGN